MKFQNQLHFVHLLVLILKRSTPILLGNLLCSLGTNLSFMISLIKICVLDCTYWLPSFGTSLFTSVLILLCSLIQSFVQDFSLCAVIIPSASILLRSSPSLLLLHILSTCSFLVMPTCPFIWYTLISLS